MFVLLGSKHHLCCYLPIAKVCGKREFQRLSTLDCVRVDVPAAHRMTVGSRAPICFADAPQCAACEAYRGCSQEAALPISSCVHHQTLLCAQTVYRCRKCRSLLLTSANIVDAEAGPSELAGDWRSRYSGGDANGETQPGCLIISYICLGTRVEAGRNLGSFCCAMPVSLAEALVPVPVKVFDVAGAVLMRSTFC